MRNQIYIAERTFDREAAQIARAASVRTASSEDEAGLRGMFDRLSQRSIYMRFHMPYPSVPEWAVIHFAEAGRLDGESLVAVMGDEIVGHAMYVRESGNEAEIAVIVEDGWQGRGVGKLLVTELAETAERRGVEVFTADVLGENRRMLGLLNSLFEEVESTISDGAYYVRAWSLSLGNGPMRVVRDELSESGADFSTAGMADVYGPSGGWSKAGKRYVMRVEEVV